MNNRALLLLMLAILMNVGASTAQCDFTKMKVTPKHAICENDGKLEVSVPGSCDTQIVLRKADGTWVQSGSLEASGGNSKITFHNLEVGGYKLFRVDGSLEVELVKDPILINDVYVQMKIGQYSYTNPTCSNMADPDGTITVNVERNTGVGPFVYTLTTERGTQTSPPTPNRRYTFGEHGVGKGIKPGETVTVNVVDTKNGLCHFAITQMPVVPSWLGHYLYYSTNNFGYVETNNCGEYQSELRFSINGANSTSRQLAFNYLSQPGNMTVKVTPKDGSEPYTQNLSFPPGVTAAQTSSFVIPGPLVKEGDRVELALKRYCDNQFQTREETVNTGLIISNHSSFKLDATTCQVQEEVELEYSTLYYKLNDQNGTLKLYKKEGSNWVETQPKSGTLNLTQGVNYPYSVYGDIVLYDYGTYKLVYTDACGEERLSREITVDRPSTGYIAHFTSTAPSMHGNTRGIDIRLKNFAPGNIKFRIDSKNGPETKTFTATKPFSTETFQASITFPYEFVENRSGSGDVHINDIPVGDYTVTVTDKCGNTDSREFSVKANNLLEYHPKQDDFYVDGIQTHYGCSNSNRIFLDFQTKDRERGYVNLYNKDLKRYFNKDGVPSSDYSGLYYSDRMSYNNLPSGNYELHLHSFSYSSTNHSLILKETYNTSYREDAIRQKIPFTIKPYEEIRITNYTTMCDDTTDSGIIDTHITSGTPVYPIRYVLYDKATGTQLKEVIDDTFGSTSNLFTGLPKGTYTVRAYNGWNATLGTFCGATEGDVVIEDYGIPEIVKGEDNITIGNSSTLSMPVSPTVYKVTWYKVTPAGEEEIGTGNSITVTPDAKGTHRYKAKVSYKPGVTPCAPGRTHEKETTLNVLGKNYWMGTPTSTDWDVASNWTGNRLPIADESIEFATVENFGTAAKNDLYIAQGGAVKERVIRNLTNNSDKNLVINTDTKLTINGTVTDNNPNKGTIVVKTAPDAPAGTLIFTNPANNKAVDAKVEFYSQAYECANCGMFRKGWQYFGVPVQEGTFPYAHVTGEESINEWKEPHNGDKWQPVGATDNLHAFRGYQITNKVTSKPTDVYTFSGRLNVGDATIPLTRTSNVNYSGVNLVANSFTGALPLNSTAINLPSSVEQTIYLFNTGTRDQWRRLNGSAINQQGYRSGQYLAVPLNLGGTAHFPDRIPAMQTFMLLPADPNGSGNLGNMMLRYGALVKNEPVKLGDGTTSITTRSVSEGEVNKESTTIPSLFIDVIGKESADRVYLFTQAGTTLGYDDGWDGRKMEESHLAQLYAVGADDSKLQVSTSSTLDNLQIAFVADSEGEYTLEFALSDELQNEEIFLNDLVTGKRQKVVNGATYQFMAKRGDILNRFQLSSTSNFRLGEANEITVHGAGRGSLVVLNNSDLGCSVGISDLEGTLIRTVEVPAQREVAVEHLQSGIYIVRIQNALVNDVKKVIVQ